MHVYIYNLYIVHSLQVDYRWKNAVKRDVLKSYVCLDCWREGSCVAYDARSVPPVFVSEGITLNMCDLPQSFLYIPCNTSWLIYFHASGPYYCFTALSGCITSNKAWLVTMEVHAFCPLANMFLTPPYSVNIDCLAYHNNDLWSPLIAQVWIMAPVGNEPCLMNPLI